MYSCKYEQQHQRRTVKHEYNNTFEEGGVKPQITITSSVLENQIRNYVNDTKIPNLLQEGLKSK